MIWELRSNTATGPYGRIVSLYTPTGESNSTNIAQSFGYAQYAAVQYAAVQVVEASQNMTMTAAQTAVVMANAMMVVTGSSASAIWGHTAWDYARHQVPETKRAALQRKREAVRRTTAEIKAEELLRSCLSRSQDEELTKYGWFDVPVKDKTYRVKRGIAGNVFLLGEDGREVERFCIHPSGVPAGDAMLAQKLLLETDERKFRKVANITSLR